MFTVAMFLLFAFVAACGGSGDARSQPATSITQPESTTRITEPQPTTSVTEPTPGSTSTSITEPTPGSTSTDPRPTAGDAEPQFGSGDLFSVSAALEQIPLERVAGPETRFEIYVADFLAAGEIGGGVRPTGSTDIDETVAWTRSITPSNLSSHAQVYVQFPDIFRGESDIAGYNDEMGFTINDVDASIEMLSPTTTNRVIVLAGEIEPAASVEVADGVFTFGEGDDFEIDFERKATARPLGRPLRSAAVEGLAVLSHSTVSASAWLDEASPRLDSDEELAMAAKSLDSQNVISAALFRRDFTVADEIPGFVVVAGPPLSEPFDSLLQSDVPTAPGLILRLLLFSEHIFTHVP